MESRTILTRRFLVTFIFLFILTALNAGLFGYLYYAKANVLRFAERTDGVLLFGDMRLLEGGYLQINKAFVLSWANHLQGSVTGGDFRLESLSPDQFTLTRERAFDGIRIGPSEIRRWGDVPRDSHVGQQVRRLIDELASR